MKNILLATLVATQLFTQLHAEDEMNNETKETPFYVVVKGMMILGDSMNEEHAVLKGDIGYGYGIDLGYRIGNGFAVEYDFSYASNNVTETVGEEINKASANYYTSALDIVYTIEATEKLGLFGKVGYEYEWEKISDYNIDNRNSGFVFGAGVEIEMNEKYKLITEYEHSLIEGPRGDSLFIGLDVNF